MRFSHDGNEQGFRTFVGTKIAKGKVFEIIVYVNIYLRKIEIKLQRWLIIIN